MTTKGPLFDGSAEQIIDNAVLHGQDAIAQEAVDLVHGRLGQVLRHPTGRYASRVVVDRSMPDRPVITDGGIVYGPWLEGTASRNTRSRFKGYQTFRRTTEDLQNRAATIAGPVILHDVQALNG
jgi:hypothetical protein